MLMTHNLAIEGNIGTELGVKCLRIELDLVRFAIGHSVTFASEDAVFLLQSRCFR